MPETMEDLKTSIEKIVRTRFPESFLHMNVSTLGGATRPSLGVHFALGKDKDAWPSHIIRNDPAHTVFLVHTKADGRGNISDLELSSNIHGFASAVLYPVTQTYGSDKAGWRDIKKPTNIAGVEKNLIKYFDNMKALAAEYLKQVETATPPQPEPEHKTYQEQSSSPSTPQPITAQELANRYVEVTHIDERQLLATITEYPNTPLKSERLASIYAHLSREEANILSQFSNDHDRFYTDLMVVDKNLPLDKQVPRNIRDISRESVRDMIKLDDTFFDKAFNNPETNRPYQISGNIRQLSERLCKDNNIKGTSDPMYIANLTAYELGLGDGQGNFVTTRSAASEDLDRLTNRINSAYRSNITDPSNTRAKINRLCAPFVMTPEELKAAPEFKYIVTIKGQNDKDIVYGFYDKQSITAYSNELNKQGKYISYSISDNKQEQATTDKTSPPTENIMYKLIKAGIKPEQMGNHASDLYVEVNDISKAVIKDYQFKQNVTTFKSQIDGKLNYEIPFAYTPAYDKSQRADSEKTAPGLPHHCYSKNEETGESIILIRGESGYKPAPYITDVEAQNKKLGVTKAQEESMIAGSMFGWNCPAANPMNAQIHDYEKSLVNSLSNTPVDRAPELERGTPNLGITRHNVGDKVAITLENMQVMVNNSHSIHANPSDIFVAKCKEIYETKTEGIVTNVFPPGYDVTATFGKDTMHEQSLHMKDNYITNLTQKDHIIFDGTREEAMHKYSDRSVLEDGGKVHVFRTADTFENYKQPTPTFSKEVSSSLPSFPALSATEAKELNDFTAAITKNYPTANPENLTKLCTIASDMSKYTIQNTNGTLSDEKYNSLTDSQEKQVKMLIKDLPYIKPIFAFSEKNPAIELKIPSTNFSVYLKIAVPEISKDKLTMSQEPIKALEQTKTKKR